MAMVVSAVRMAMMVVTAAVVTPVAVIFVMMSVMPIAAIAVVPAAVAVPMMLMPIGPAERGAKPAVLMISVAVGRHKVMESIGTVEPVLFAIGTVVEPAAARIVKGDPAGLKPRAAKQGIPPSPHARRILVPIGRSIASTESRVGQPRFVVVVSTTTLVSETEIPEISPVAVEANGYVSRHGLKARPRGEPTGRASAGVGRMERSLPAIGRTSALSAGSGGPMGLSTRRRISTRNSVGRSIAGCLIRPQDDPSSFKAMSVLRLSVVELLPARNSRSEIRRPVDEIAVSIDETRPSVRNGQ